MAYGHMAPEEGFLAFEDLGRPYVLPIHHRTFPLADTGYDQPLVELQRVIAGKPEAEKRIVPLAPGENRMIPR
jgi:L-ascorbate metabolism protein UlaG (beta-lactamase superfamily)